MPSRIPPRRWLRGYFRSTLPSILFIGSSTPSEPRRIPLSYVRSCEFFSSLFRWNSLPEINCCYSLGRIFGLPFLLLQSFIIRICLFKQLFFLPFIYDNNMKKSRWFCSDFRIDSSVLHHSDTNWASLRFIVHELNCKGFKRRTFDAEMSSCLNCKSFALQQWHQIVTRVLTA